MSKLTLLDLHKEIDSLEVEGKDPIELQLKPHTASTIEPMMGDEDFESLLNDVMMIGVIHTPIILIDDWIVDGRNRYKAAKKTKTELPVKYLKQHYSKSVLEEYVRSIHMRRNKTKDQLAIQAYEYKSTVANVTWKTAAGRFGVSETKVKTINTIANKLNESNRVDDLQKMLSMLKNSKELPAYNMSNGFTWLHTPVTTINAALKQLKETGNTVLTSDNIDFTDFDENGVERSKQSNAIHELTDTSLLSEVEQLKAIIAELRNTISELRSKDTKC